jgi:STE24 endopeptidase
VIFALAISSVTSMRLRLHPNQAERILSISSRWRSIHTWLWIATVGVISLGIGWPQMVRFSWGFDGAFLIDELLILLPVLLPLALSWIAFYGIERATYSVRLAAGRVGSKPAPSLRHTLSLHARHYFGVMLLPILILIAAQDALALWLPNVLRSGWSVAVYAAPIVLLIAFFPILLRRLWKTRPLGAGTLRERLTALSARAGLPVREILVWETRGVVVNAAVSGWIPGYRYVFLTDGLIDRLTAEEIEAVFGHELGHIRRRHLLLRGLAMVAPLSLLLAVELVWPASGQWFQTITTRFNAVAQLPLAVSTLAVLSSYAYFVFGGFCRILEKEADLYGCRMLLAETPDEACRVCVSALEKLGVESGLSRNKSSWQHPSIARRTEFLAEVSCNSDLRRRFECRVRWLDWLLIACVLVPAFLAVVA